MITLHKSPEKDFIILNFSDPQLGDDEWAPDHQNRKILTGTATEIINRVKPDLITISGDLAWSQNYEAYRQLGNFIESFGIPWTCCWGNHDNESGPEAVNKVADEYLTHPLFKYEKGDPMLGNGNFVIKIEENGKTAEGIIVMDTHDRMPFTDENGKTSEEWAKLLPEQLDWYEEQINALKAEGCNDTTIITHIPCYAFREAFDVAFRKDVDQFAVRPGNSTGSEFWNPGYESSFGVKREGDGSYPADDGVLARINKLGSTKHYLAGHDHISNFVIPYKGVKLIFSLKLGAGCYWETFLNGGTVLRITGNGVAEVRHEYVDPAKFTE